MAKKSKKKTDVATYPTPLDVAKAEENKFTDYFHSKTHIASWRTNRHIIHAVFKAMLRKHDVLTTGNVEVLTGSNGAGVTTTFIELAKWLRKGGANVLVIASDTDCYHREGINAKTWRASLMGMHPRPDIVFIDRPLTLSDRNSESIMYRFNEYIQTFPFNAVCVQQQRSALDGR